MGIFVSDLLRNSFFRSLDTSSKFSGVVGAGTRNNAVPALFPQRSSFISNYDGILFYCL